jgi:hypothetical protein
MEDDLQTFIILSVYNSLSGFYDRSYVETWKVPIATVYGAK